MLETHKKEQQINNFAKMREQNRCQVINTQMQQPPTPFEYLLLTIWIVTEMAGSQ